VQTIALNIFVTGVTSIIRNILVARNVGTFEEAVIIATEQEKTTLGKFKGHMENNYK